MKPRHTAAPKTPAAPRPWIVSDLFQTRAGVRHVSLMFFDRRTAAAEAYSFNASLTIGLNPDAPQPFACGWVRIAGLVYPDGVPMSLDLDNNSAQKAIGAALAGLNFKPRATAPQLAQAA